MSDSLPNMATMLTSFKTQFLDNYNVGIRQFSRTAEISRTRLEKFFTGEKSPTEDEIMKISMAMDVIVANHAKAMELRERKAFENDATTFFKDAIKIMKEEEKNGI